MVTCFQAGGQRGEAGEFGAAALAQCQPTDAAGGEFVEHGVGGQLGVEHQQAGVFAGGGVPVVGEGDDLAGLFGLGDLGVGVDHLGAGVVLGEEGEHRAGALGAFGHVVLFQDAVAGRGRVVAVVADGVEVAVEPGLAGGQPECAQGADQPGEQLLVGFAAHPVGVGAQVGGLGQGGQSEGGGQAEVVDQRAEVVDPGAAGALGQQQRRDRLPSGERRVDG